MTRLTVLILTLLLETEGYCPSGTNWDYHYCNECRVGYTLKSDETDCEACPRGQYRSRGMSACRQCAPNKISHGGASVCTPCLAGTFANDERTRCVDCRPGTYRRTYMSRCESCPINQITTYNEYCTSCKEGLTPNTDQTRCVNCPNGTYKDKTMLKCADCPRGTIHNSKRNACVSCPSGTYTNQTVDKCVTCPRGTISNPWKSACDGDKYYWKWSAVKRNVMIDFDPKNSIEIRTTPNYIVRTTPDYVRVGFYRKTNSSVGAVKIRFSGVPMYNILSCSQDYTKFPVQPPSQRGVDQIWRITVQKSSDVRIIIHCNGVEVLNTWLYNEWRNVDVGRPPCYYNPYTFGRWSLVDHITQLMVSTSSEDRVRQSYYYRFFKSDVIPEDGNPCPDNAYHCASGQCWVKEEPSSGVYTDESRNGYGVTKCLCIIDGNDQGKETEYLRNNTDFEPGHETDHYKMVQFIQCKEQWSNNMTQHEETKVTCGWYFEDRKDWSFLSRGANHWNYGRTSGIMTVGTPHDCSGNKTWKIVLIVLSSVAFVLILILIVWKLRKKDYCRGYRNSRTHRAIPSDMVTRHGNPIWEPQAQHEPTVSESETPPQRPSNPTILRTASIPTYRECLEASDRIVTENDYVTLPTVEPSAPPYNDGTLEELPPTYEDVQEHQDLYAVAQVEQQNAAHP